MKSAQTTDMVVRARRLRRNMTDAETLLWSRLRGRRLRGAKFRRQKPIGPFIVDFVCVDRKLVIEIDGDQHGINVISANDIARTKWLEGKGFRVVRFSNSEVLVETEGVLGVIFDELALPSP